MRKIRADRIEQAEVEHALSHGPILIFEQDANANSGYVYYGEVARSRMIAVVLTERDEKIRVITAYDLDAGHLNRRAQKELQYNNGNPGRAKHRASAPVIQKSSTAAPRFHR